MPWYALRSKPNKESMLCQQLDAQAVQVFYPQVHVKPINPRARKMKPYFPGYIFVNIDLVRTGTFAFQWMPHSNGLVSFGGEPACVPDALVSAIRKRLNEIEAAGGEIFMDLKPGDRVFIASGPLAGYEAIFDSRLSGEDRVRVLLKLIEQRQVPVDLHVGQIQKKRL